MEHIEEAGIHSGDSACALPPFSLPAATIDEIKQQARALARELDVRGLMNIQFAVPRDGRGVFILEVNPRASRTVPFVSKVTGVPLAKVAAKIAVGRTLKEMGIKEVTPEHIAVKEAVFPFVKFPGVDTLLGPEMRSTGEVMGIDRSFDAAFAKSQIAAGTKLPIPDAVAQADRLPVAAGLGQGGRGGRGQRPAGRWASRWWPPTAPTNICARRGSRWSGSTRCARAAPTASIACWTETSIWSSTPPRGPRRSATPSPSAGRR